MFLKFEIPNEKIRKKDGRICFCRLSGRGKNAETRRIPSGICIPAVSTRSTHTAAIVSMTVLSGSTNLLRKNLPICRSMRRYWRLALLWMPLVADYQYPLVQYSIECVRARELLGVVRADRHGTRVEDVDARGPPAMAGAVTPGAAPPSNRVSSILGSVFPVPNVVDERGGVGLGGRGPRPGLLDPAIIGSPELSSSLCPCPTPRDHSPP